MTDNRTTEPMPCPFCGSEAYTLNQAPKGTGYSVGCHDDECRGFIALSWIYNTEAEAIAAWNTRCHSVFEETVIKAWEEIKGYQERTCHNASYRVDESRFHCSMCSFGCWVRDVADGRDKLPNYCPNCGAKVIGGDAE